MLQQEPSKQSGRNHSRNNSASKLLRSPSHCQPLSLPWQQSNFTARSHGALRGLTSACQSQGLCGPSITQRKWDFTAHFSTMTRVGGNPMARTGAVWMISIWHSSTFNHSWFRFQLLVHLDLCRWFNKQTQYIVHHANCIIKLLTYFQTSSFYSSVPLSFPSFPLFSFISKPRRGFAFFPKPESIKDPIMSEVSPTALQTAHCWRIFPEVV